MTFGADERIVQPPGVKRQGLPRFPEAARQKFRIGGGKASDGANPQILQLHAHFPPYAEQISHRKFPDDFGNVFGKDHSGGVGLFIVTAQLCKDFVIGYADGDGDADLLFYLPAKAIRDSFSVPEQPLASGDVQPGFVDTEGFYEIGIIPINGVDAVADLLVLVVVRRDQQQVWTFLLCLPNGLRRLNPKGFGFFILCKNDSVALGGIARHRHGNGAIFRMVNGFHRRKKIVAITMKDDPTHGHVSPSDRSAAVNRPERAFSKSVCKDGS